MKHKTLGQVYTPKWVVKEILDLVGFRGKRILNKKIIDPACGDGAFLKVIVERVIDEATKNSKPINEIKEILRKNIYGIEIDKNECSKCIKNLDEVVKNKLNINLKISWNIHNKDTLIAYKKYINFFDFVVGNPPYIRVHNLNKKTKNLLKKEFIFSEGTIDIYLAFFELGFKLLNKKGTLGYISPNSYLHNSSYIKFRRYLKKKKAIKTLIDFKSNKIFKDFSTYTAITIINFSEEKNSFEYKELIDGKITKINDIPYDNINDKDWSFASKEDMEFINKIHSNTNQKISDFFDVQYGFATLRDKIFIGKITKEKGKLVLFNNSWIEKDILHKIVKASTYKGTPSEIQYIIFPYKKFKNRFIPFTENELKNKYPYTYKYLLDNKKELIKRDIDKGAAWYEFGRSQGIQTMHKEKIVISTLMKKDIKYYFLDKDTFVYSGIFITKKDKKVDWKIIKEILNSNEFKKYIKITGKNFSGGYKSITSKQIKNFPTKELNNQKKLVDVI